MVKKPHFIMSRSVERRVYVCVCIQDVADFGTN